ncbi:MAG: PIN domain-containing protein [Bacillota bacterium]
MKRIMFDSNVFDQLPAIIETIKPAIGQMYELCVTTVQVEELCETPDPKKEKRAVNMLMLADLRPRLVPLSVCVLGSRARLGYARFGDGEVYEQILNASRSNTDDALIADTAVTEGCTLVTEDRDLYSRMQKNGYAVMSLSEFLATIPGV